MRCVYTPVETASSLIACDSRKSVELRDLKADVRTESVDF